MTDSDNTEKTMKCVWAILTNIAFFLAEISVADPGFSPGGANSQKCYYFSIFCQKLHENERIWTPGGGGGARVPGAPPWIRQ